MIRRVSTFAAVRPSAAAASSSVFRAAVVSAPLLATSHRFASGGKNPYKVLGCKTGADRAIVKKAYRVMAKKYHPDAPGGSHEKFQEIQMAYEQVKTGVWVPTDEGGNAKATNRYQGMNFTTNSSKGQNRSYEDFFREMHTGRETQFDDDGEVPKKKKAGPMGANEDRVQAWFRLIGAWASIFCTLRVLLIFVFPPKYQHHKKKPMSDMPRGAKLAPPKPLLA